MRKRYKCTFNTAQLMSPIIMYWGNPPITLERSINLDDMVKSLPKKELGDYSPEFLKWFVDWHANLLDMARWEHYPVWLIQMLKTRAEELHDGLKFNR